MKDRHLHVDPSTAFPIVLPVPLFWAMGSHLARERLSWVGCHMVLCCVFRLGEMAEMASLLSLDSL